MKYGRLGYRHYINGKMGEKFTALNYLIPCPPVLLRGCFGDKAQSWAVKEAVQ